MAQPQAYVPTVNFQSEESGAVAGRSTVRTPALDTELLNISTTIAQLRANLALIQRDDTFLLDSVVKLHTLSAEVLALISSNSFTIRGNWSTPTAYAIGDIVEQSSLLYICIVAHTSGVFATDLAAAKWGQLSGSTTASNQSFTATTNIAATNVQAAIEEVDGELRPTVSLYNQERFGGL